MRCHEYPARVNWLRIDTQLVPEKQQGFVPTDKVLIAVLPEPRSQMNEIVVRPQLAKIASDLQNGRDVQAVTTREFLSWFQAQRRGYWIVREIREELEKAGLQTVPDFEAAYIDAPLELRQVVAASRGKKSAQNQDVLINSPNATDAGADSSDLPKIVTTDPTYRISKLDPANQPVVSVRPDATLAECITILMSRDFSQLPVMTGDREVKGVVSWKTIGSRLALSNGASKAQDFMAPHYEIRASASLFDAIPPIISHEYVLVRDGHNRISGIITASDLSQQFMILAEPFLLLAEIENLVRSMIGDRFKSEELAGARDPADAGRQVSGVADLTFGEYIRLLQNPDRWQKLGLAVDRATFCKDLEAIRDIRNDVMHFDPESIVEQQLDKLRNFTNFLKQIQAMLMHR